MNSKRFFADFNDPNQEKYDLGLTGFCGFWPRETFWYQNILIGWVKTCPQKMQKITILIKKLRMAIYLYFCQGLNSEDEQFSNNSFRKLLFFWNLKISLIYLGFYKREKLYASVKTLFIKRENTFLKSKNTCFKHENNFYRRTREYCQERFTVKGKESFI